MSAQNTTTDYLILGSGAVGMAFADVLLDETDADIVIVDRHAAPGGHWNDAYPFVTLHQPSAFYGVNSIELSRGRVDQDGLNAGLNELATGTEVLAYFDDVMRHKFLPSGRVRYFPMCHYEGEGRFENVLTGEQHSITPQRKTVDATWLKTSVPSTHTPNFSIAEGVTLIPPNQLPRVDTRHDDIVIVGAGKTAMDTVLWLLGNGVDPDAIRWITPRDSWVLNRKMTQPGVDFFLDTFGAVADQMQAIAEASDLDDLWLRLEAAGNMLRIDPDRMPEMFHGATVSEAELAQLRRIKNVVRLGRISAIETDRIVMAEGEIPASANTLYVDCSARAIPNEDITPIFNGNLITPQTVRPYQPVFSAALIAHIEAAYDSEAQKNELCEVVPLPNNAADWAAMTLVGMMNQYKWSQEEGIRAWMKQSRLDGLSSTLMQIDKKAPDNQAVLQRMRNYMMPAAANLQKLIAAA
ncbi:MAG: NAD(P)/FAD-dependent oxidoreductase [Pseudomonadota bacterium]